MKTTISNILSLIKQGKNDSKIRDTAVYILKSQGISATDYFKIFDAMLNFVRENIMFVRDPTKEDVCFHPIYTLNKGYGDCEDHSIVLASLLESIGIPTELVIISKTGDVWDHAYIKVGYPPDKPNKWIPLDGTISGPPGTEVKYVKQKIFKVR